MLKADDLCGLCEALFKDLCLHERDPVLCQVYEDYVTGRVKGELPLQFVIKRVGMAKIGQAAMRLKAAANKGVIG